MNGQTNQEASISNPQQRERTNWWCRLFSNKHNYHRCDAECKQSGSNSPTWFRFYSQFSYEGATLCPDHGSIYYNVLRLTDLDTSFTGEGQFYYVQIKNHSSLAIWISRHPPLGNKADIRTVSRLGHFPLPATLMWHPSLPLVPSVSKQPTGPRQLQDSACAGTRAGASKDRNLLLRGVGTVRFWRRSKPRRRLFGCRSGKLGESSILQRRKAGFKVLRWCVDPETRNQATNWPGFFYYTQFKFFLFSFFLLVLGIQLGAFSMLVSTLPGSYPQPYHRKLFQIPQKWT